MQRALIRFFKPENDMMVREALLEVGRGDLIGSGCDCLIPAQPPKAALRARMEKANESLGEGKYAHQIANPARATDRGARRRTVNVKRNEEGAGSCPRP